MVTLPALLATVEPAPTLAVMVGVRSVTAIEAPSAAPVDTAIPKALEVVTVSELAFTLTSPIVATSAFGPTVAVISGLTVVTAAEPFAAKPRMPA